MLQYHSGFHVFNYGKMGEVIENNHTFVLPNETYPYSFKMQYTYDSWKICASRMKKGQVLSSEAQPNLRVANRVRTITYPDGEVASYEYGMGGMPKRRLGMGIAKRIEFPMPHNLSPFNFQFSPPPARYYHSDLSIWLSVDPMSDKYPNLSPYTYCADNPIIYKDPNGRKIDPVSEKNWNNNKQVIIEKKVSIDAVISILYSKGEQRGWSNKKIERKTHIYKERSQSLQNTLNVMHSLEECMTETYMLTSRDKNGSFSQGLGVNSGKMQIAYSSIESFIHEVTHAGQYHRRELGYVNGTLSGYDIQDEINAYKAVLAYNPSYYDNTYHNMSDITIEWVKYGTSDGKHYPYKDLPEKSVNFNLYKSDRRYKYGPL